LDEYWWKLAACQPEDDGERFHYRSKYFYSDAGSDEEIIAKLQCSHCTVRRDCLEYALVTHEEHGIWGGLNERERKKLYLLADTYLSQQSESKWLSSDDSEGNTSQSTE
jgi:WhiB family redox-sensing transcriptional regulator